MTAQQTQIQIITDTVCIHYGVSLERLMDNTRNRGTPYREMRQVIAHLTRTFAEDEYSLKRIANELGMRNHSTIHNSLKAVENNCFSNAEFAREYGALKLICEIRLKEENHLTVPAYKTLIKEVSENEISVLKDGNWVIYIKA